jgi:CHAT domain-containing protein
MKKTILIVFFFISNVFGQTPNSLEEKIYGAVDVFVAHSSHQAVQELEKFEKQCQPKTNPEFLALVILNCNKAYYQNQWGQTANAIFNYEKAWNYFKKNNLNNYDIIEYCLKPLGNLYTIIGDYDAAQNTIKQYLYMADKQNNKEHKIAAIVNLSNVYLSTGKSSEAIKLLEKTLLVPKLPAIQKGNLYNNLGTNYLMLNNFKKAEFAFQKGLQFFKSQKNQEENCANGYQNLVQLYVNQQQFDHANEIQKEARVNFNKIKHIEPRKRAKFCLTEATLALAQGNTEEVKNQVAKVFKTLIPSFYDTKEVLPKKENLYGETTLIEALDLQANFFITQKQPKKALQSYEFSFHVESILTEMMVHENSKIITQIRNRNRTEKCIELLYEIYHQEKKNQYLEKAFELCENNKSSVLLESVNKLKSATAQEKKILQELQDQKNVILKEQQKFDSANISVINEAIKKQNELVFLLKSNKEVVAQKTRKSQSIKGIFSKLNKENAILISYFFGQKNLYSFTLKNDAIQFQKLASTAIFKTTVLDFLDFFKDSQTILEDILGYQLKAKKVFDALQIPENENSKNLIILLDGLLNFVPFEALITKVSTTTNFAKMNYLIQDYTIIYNNSVAFYMKNDERKSNNNTVLGLFPVFENSNLELRYSLKEMDAIKKCFDGKYLEKGQATFENFTKNAPFFPILHLSTHATAGDIDIPSAIRFYDQEILYSELYNLKSNPDLVVLSACETGLGKWYASEGAMSISRGFQMAGAKNVLFSLWKVNDYTTSIFMSKFYEILKEENNFCAANHQAKLDFLDDKSISNFKKSPYFWAPMVFYGTVESKNTSNYLMYLFVFLGLILGYFGYRKLKNKT